MSRIIVNTQRHDKVTSQVQSTLKTKHINIQVEMNTCSSHHKRLYECERNRILHGYFYYIIHSLSHDNDESSRRTKPFDVCE